MNSRIWACGTGLAPTLTTTGFAGSRLASAAGSVEPPPQAVRATRAATEVAASASFLRNMFIPLISCEPGSARGSDPADVVPPDSGVLAVVDLLGHPITE